MTAYELYLVLHVVAATAWVGAAFVMVVLATRARAASDTARVTALAEDGAWLGPHVFLPANLLVLVSALLLVHEGRWSYDPLWIRLAAIGFAASFLTGALFFGPGFARVVKAPHDPRSRHELRRLLVVSWVDLGLLLAIVFLMTVKPAAGEWAALAVTAAIPLAVALLSLALVRPAAPEAEAAVS
jgi:hypothetical protein